MRILPLILFSFITTQVMAGSKHKRRLEDLPLKTLKKKVVTCTIELAEKYPNKRIALAKNIEELGISPNRYNTIQAIKNCKKIKSTKYQVPHKDLSEIYAEGEITENTYEFIKSSYAPQLDHCNAFDIRAHAAFLLGAGAGFQGVICTTTAGKRKVFVGPFIWIGGGIGIAASAGIKSYPVEHFRNDFFALIVQEFNLSTMIFISFGSHEGSVEDMNNITYHGVGYGGLMTMGGELGVAIKIFNLPRNKKYLVQAYID